MPALRLLLVLLAVVVVVLLLVLLAVVVLLLVLLLLLLLDTHCSGCFERDLGCVGWRRWRLGACQRGGRPGLRVRSAMQESVL